MFQMADNISQVRRNINTLEQEVRKQRDAIAGETNPDRKQKLVDELGQMVTSISEMRVSLRRLERWAEDKGLQPQAAYKQMLKTDANPPKLDQAERLQIRKQTVQNVLENSSPEARKRLIQGNN
jgi:HAMP domain-containing protein